MSRPHFQNKLLALVPPAELEILYPLLEPIDLPKGFAIATAGEPIQHVYFLEQGLGSIVSVSRQGQKAEAGMFGYEGFAPTPPAVRSTMSFHDASLQAEGYGYRITIEALWAAMDRCPKFSRLLARSSQNLATQVSYTALSNAVHQVNERLARWLLMSHDRLRQDEFLITHDYMALILAVRRPSVTTALHVLEERRFIRAERGCVTIRNRSAMEHYAQDAYGLPEEEYRHLFP